MKNITVLPVLVIIVYALILNNSAYCQDLEKEQNYCFSFGTQYGFIYGQALEYVYPVPGVTKGEFLSELKWDTKPVYYYGAQMDFGRRDIMKNPGFFFSVSYISGIPGISGIMEDRDWMSTENSALTHFSSHTNKTLDFYQLDLKAGVSLPVKSYFYIKPYLSGSWTHFSFTGRDGYGIYAKEKNSNTYYPIDQNPDKYQFFGEVIRYKQNWLLAAIGVSLGTKVLPPFLFDLSFQISPFTYCAGVDEHLIRRAVFNDITGWGLFLEPSGSFSFTIEQMEFSLQFNYRYIGKTKGKTYTNNSPFPADEEAGAGLSYLSSRFIVRVML